MNWDSVKEKITDYAPLIASLLGGPKGFAVQALVSKLLGTDSDPKAIEAALSPENLEKIRKMEIENEQELMKLNVQALTVEVEDRKHAREHADDSKMPEIICIVLTLIAAVYGTGLFFVEIPDANRDLISYFGGQLITLWAGSVAYWVGTTRGSSFKNKLLARFSTAK